MSRILFIRKGFLAAYIFASGTMPLLYAADSKYANEWFNDGFEALKKGEMGDAQIWFKTGLTLDPNNGLAHLYLANVLRVTLNSYAEEEALEHYEKAAELLGGNDLDGLEAAEWARKLRIKYPPPEIDLKKNPQLVNGKWCFKTSWMILDTNSPYRVVDSPDPLFADASRLAWAGKDTIMIEQTKSDNVTGKGTEYAQFKDPELINFQMINRNEIVIQGTIDQYGKAQFLRWSAHRCK